MILSDCRCQFSTLRPDGAGPHSSPRSSAPGHSGARHGEDVTSQATPVQVRNLPAQRLWVLERGEAVSVQDGQRACRFVGAVAVLDEGAVYVVFVMSPDPLRASERPLQTGTLRLDVERDAFKFATLDEAMAWTTVQKESWLQRGWTEAQSGGDHD
jgi:hypothetical protein